VAQIREDLGSTGPVIARQVEEATLGRRATLDDTRLGDSRALRALLAQQRTMDERVARLRDELEASREALHLRPERVERVVHGERARDLTATLSRRATEEREHVAATLSELEATIRREAFGEGDDQLQLITGLELDAGDRRQVQRDRDALRERLDAIPGEIAAEQAAIDRRYAEPTHRLFPAAVTLLVGEGGRL
jgi:uncharacterized protein YhaN